MTIRYSPKPIEAYGTVVRVQRVGAQDTELAVGPHTSPLLANDPEAWNLAFLSFPYEDDTYGNAPAFSVHIRRTLQVDVATGELDITETQAGLRVRLFLRYPPLKAVRLLLGLQPHVLRKLPMHLQYGDGWLEAIQQRASMLASMDDPDNAVEIVDVTQAAEYLTKLTGGAA